MVDEFAGTAAVFESLCARLGGRMPSRYLVADVETTGVQFSSALITQVGWAIVRDDRIIDNSSVLLDWTRHPAVDEMWLRRQLDNVRGYFERKGSVMHFPYERLRDEGEDPATVLQDFADFVEDTLKREELLVGHNLWHFDRRMIDGNLLRFLHGRKLPWVPNAIFDTGLVEKAVQLGLPLFADESLDHWYQRVYRVRAKGVLWNLEHHCVQKYRLNEGNTLPPGMAHDAGYDCVPTHRLLQAYKRLLESLDDGTR